MTEHAFFNRSKSLRSVLFALMSEGPVSWEAIFGAGRGLGLSDSTVRNTVNEGVSFGVFEKTGGKTGKGHGPAMVSLTQYGYAWLPTEIDDDGEDAEDEVMFCKHDNITAICNECSPQWRGEGAPVEEAGGS